MEQDFFELLPPEIITNILLRLNLRTVIISKCVCKLWLEFFSSDEFLLSRSAAGLAVLSQEGNSPSTRCAAFELDADDHRYNHFTQFDLPHSVTIRSSANGMLLLQTFHVDPTLLLVLNPISREYIELHLPRGFFNEVDNDIDEAAYGFGATKISGQHKVVCFKYALNDCHVYTLGTGSWRRVEAPCLWAGLNYVNGVFVNGNIYWTAYADRDADQDSIYRFDLETECFSTVAAPPLVGDCHNLSVLRDCLCLTVRDTSGRPLVIWLMKEYGDEKSWLKEYVIDFGVPWCHELGVYPIKVLRNGDILLVWHDRSVRYYSAKTKTIEFRELYGLGNFLRLLMPFTPSFLSLKKNFPMENVISL